jgi:flagellar basal-body rod protein FlgC
MAVFTSIDEGGFLRELMKQASRGAGEYQPGGGKTEAPPPPGQQEYGRFNKDFRSIGSYLLKSQDMSVNAGGVKVARIVEDPTDFKAVYDPSHPDADEEGYVFLPNVNRTQEMIDMLAATRAYSANVTVFNATKAMIGTALQIGR